MHSVMRTLGRYRADTAAARCAVCGGARLWRGAVRGAREAVASASFWVGLRRGAGLTLKMKTRVGARLLVAPRGATCWYGSTHASYGVRFSSTNHQNSPDELAPPLN